ncbi:MAG: phosphoribosyltransferase family protein [Ferruginibacter sp.]
MLSLKNIFSGLFHLLYPHNCTGCGSDLLPKGQLLCIACISELPHTCFAGQENNPIEKIFRGRLPVSAAHSQFYFAKNELIQHLIHELKYNNNKEIGISLGEMLGISLLQSGRYTSIDYLIPLPLHLKKEFRRGYNQAAIICEGISRSTSIPMMPGNVTRQRVTDTQTRKHRAERWNNVAGSFIIKNPEKLAGKHILLVDDVITTGATIEACGLSILKINGTSLSIASLAHASK